VEPCAVDMNRLHEVALDMDARTSISGVLQAIVEWARRLLDAQMVAVYLLDESGPRLDLAIRMDLQDELLATSLPLDQTPDLIQRLGWQETQELHTVDGRRRILALPLIVGQRLTGRLMLSDCNQCEFSTNDIRLAHLLASQAAVALENHKSM
jgi:GAF domain-containing protein